MQPKLIIHGGAWDWSDDLDTPKRQSIIKALEIAWTILNAGGSALDAVEKAVNWLEDDPLFDAGTGSHLNADGIVEMDALIIDGARLHFGAVAAVTRVQHPISLARKVLEDTEQNFFVGAGADALAARLGVPLVPNISLVSATEQTYFAEKRTDGASDTVGAIALDMNGHIAVATSTGGTPLKPAGRVGDSPIFGAGGYANSYGGAGATGKGEHAMRTLLSKTVVDGMNAGYSAQDAAQAAIRAVDEMIPDSMVGTIAIDHHGNLGAAHSTPKLACGWIDAEGNAKVSMRGGVLAKANQ